MNNRSFLSLGANQQAPIRMLHLARDLLKNIPQTYIAQESSIISTAAFGVTQQQHFYNQVIEIRTGLTPLQLLNSCQHIEKRLGRTRKVHWGPRLIDIDILTYNELKIEHPRLTLPHPQIWQRDFIEQLLQQLSFK
jgi:2-amino-4-hydroxy-6-hydroxymethyldihydropteridine diphosphokinase